MHLYSTNRFLFKNKLPGIGNYIFQGMQCLHHKLIKEEKRKAKHARYGHEAQTSQKHRQLRDTHKQKSIELESAT